MATFPEICHYYLTEKYNCPIPRKMRKCGGKIMRNHAYFPSSFSGEQELVPLDVVRLAVATSLLPPALEAVAGRERRADCTKKGRKTLCNNDFHLIGSNVNIKSCQFRAVTIWMSCPPFNSCVSHFE
jgi:hypothetical protein